MLSSYALLTFRSLAHRRLRSSLTVIGIVIGITVVVGLVLLGKGLRDGIASQLRQFGSDLIIALPRDVTDPAAALLDRGKFRPEHRYAVEAVDGVRAVMPTIEPRLVVGEYHGEKKTVALHGQEWALIKEVFEDSQGFRLRDGAWPDQENAREVVLGANFAEKAFAFDVRTGDELTLRGRKYRVAGVLNATGEQNHDNSVFVSLEALHHLTGERGSWTAFMIKTEPGGDIEAIGTDIERALSRQKDLDQFTVMTPEKASRVVGDVIGIVEYVLYLIALVAVVVGGIGVMNTMYTAVMERRREIGIMKAVGAKERHILALFLFESGIIGFLGGAVGLAGGAGLAGYVVGLAQRRGFMFLEAALDPATAAIVLTSAFLAGVVSGVLPARQAAALRPAAGLRQR